MKRAQTTLEYFFFVIILVGALLAMTSYIKRGIQGGWRARVDELGEQYEPKQTRSFKNYIISSNTQSSLVLSENIEVCQRDGCYTNRTDVTNAYETTYESLNVEGY